MKAKRSPKGDAHLEARGQGTVAPSLTSRGLDASTAPLSEMSAPVAGDAAAASGLDARDVAVRFAVDAENPAATPTPTAAPSGRTMVGGACVLCACVSARRWYRVDEEAQEPGDDDAGAAPLRAPSATPTYVAGLGTSRERRLPLVLAPVRSKWAGAGSNAPPNAAQLCPHCHVQNEQLWFESGSNASTASNALASVRDTVRNLDRIMGILAPARASGARDLTSRPRRRAGKKAHGGAGFATTGFARDENHENNGDEEDDALRLSRSAPASRTTSSRLSDAPLSASRAAARDASLREELQEAARLGQRRRRRWANDRLLRELGGAMTVAEMQAQFMPPPFGAPPQPTAFERMLRAQARGEWAGFHKVDMDKERAFLRELELAEAEARRERARGGEKVVFANAGVSVPGGTDATGNDEDAVIRRETDAYAVEGPRAAWGRVSAKERAALRNVVRRAPERLERLERALLEFAEAAGELAEETQSTNDAASLILPLADSYARLLAHGLCEFHGLEKASRIAESGAKELVVRPPQASRKSLWRPPAATCVSFLRSLEALR